MGELSFQDSQEEGGKWPTRKNIVLPVTIDDLNIPVGKTRKKELCNDLPGYNPADFYTDRESQDMDLGEKNNGRKYIVSSLFDCSICDKKKTYQSELSFQCRKKHCKRNFCKEFYPEDKGRPQCVGCSNFFLCRLHCSSGVQRLQIICLLQMYS